MIKRAAAIHDISGLGRCSLTAALPILSALGVQCCPIPTAVLSAQTDGYRNYARVDLTDALPDYIGHWKKNGERFDAIYTGFLNSIRQIDMVSRFIDDFRTEDTLVLVDPVMGDNGTLYDSMDRGMPDAIRTLVCHADVITPNLTEAALLLGEAELPEEEKVWLSWAQRLRELGAGAVVITGIDGGDGRVFMAYADDKASGLYFTGQTPRDFPGAGDVFAGVLLGRLLQGAALKKSVQTAADFVAECADLTYKMQTPAREGLVFEPTLHLLIK